MSTNLKSALSVVLRKEITEEQEVEVRKYNVNKPKGMENDDSRVDIDLKTFMKMIDHLSDSDETVMKRYILTQQKYTLKQVLGKISPSHQELLGVAMSSNSADATNPDGRTNTASSPTALTQPIDGADAVDAGDDAGIVTIHMDQDEPSKTQSNADPSIEMDEDFPSHYLPHQMNFLVLIAQHGMGNTMRKFVMAHKHLLSKFMILGDKRTMAMIRSIYSSQDGSQHGRKNVNQRPWEEDDIRSDYAKFSTLMDEGRIGGVILFEDPHVDSIHYEPDLDRLCELSLLKNVMVLNNPTTALMVMHTLRLALKEGKGELIPSFFVPLQHPLVLGSAAASTLAQVLDNGVENTPTPAPIPIPIPIQASTEYTHNKEDDPQHQHKRNQVEFLSQKLAAMNEEHKKVKLALANAERQVEEGHNELSSVVEGIIDVDPEEATFLLKQIQTKSRMAHSQDGDRESPLTVADDILKSQLQKVDSNDVPSHPHPSASADTPEQSFMSTLEKVSETFFLKRLSGGGDLDSSNWEGSSTPVVPSDPKVPISNADFPQIRDSKSQDVEHSIENTTPTARSSDTGENNVHVIEEIKAIKDDFSDSSKELEDSDQDEDFDTASVVYDFARPGTAPARSQSISSKYARQFITSRQSPHASNTNSSRRKPLANMEDTMDMDNRSILSASSRRDEAFENLRRRFEAFATS